MFKTYDREHGINEVLYIFVARQERLDEKKAVMAYVHGGAFNYGSGSTDEYSPDNLLDENVIVVTINYRLNALGQCTKIELFLNIKYYCETSINS